jgi:hypothetical protein
MIAARQSRNQKKTSEALPPGSYDVSCLTYKNEPEEALAKVYREVLFADCWCFKWI